MNINIIFIAIGFLCSVNGSNFDEFQKSLNKAADDLSRIDKGSADKLRRSVGLPQDPPSTLPPLTSTTAAPKKCGWFGYCEEVTTTTTTTTTTPPPPTTPPEPCGGWFQKACPPTTTTTTTTTTPPPTTTKPCGGWFRSSCDTPKGLSSQIETTTTTPAPPPKPCGGWFQSSCDTPKGLSSQIETTTTTPAPPPKPCGGWFQSSCKVVETTPTPPVETTPQSCGGWFQAACAPTTTQAPKKAWGLFGTYVVTTTTTQAPASGGWMSSILSGFTSTAGKAVGTALDVTSKIASTAMNGGVDFFLNEIKIFVKATNMDIVPLPDVSIDLYPGAHFKASGGYFKSVLSLSRGGDITISRDGYAFIIDFPIVLKDMEIGFKNYSIGVLAGVGPKGEMKVGVKENKINIRIRLAVSTSCAINLEKVDFAVLDGLDIKMTYGCSMCGYITDKATSYLTNFFRNTIRLQIQSSIDGILKKTLSENALICSKFMGG